jgi:23S rRNA pseudouridine1911/1915/1917 synthase
MGSLLFQNDACHVINKLPGESSESPEIESLFPSREETREKVFSVHRLDVPVSGCLLLARNAEAAAFLGGAFSRYDGGVEKHYWAIVERPKENSIVEVKPEAELVHWLGENKKANKSFAYPDRKAGLKKAVLRYRLIGEGKHYLFLEIELITGRHHQIRAQLAAVGLHIKGDLKYGARRSEKAGGIRLHAYSLSFPNPVNPNETIRVKAPPPVMDPLWSAFTEMAEV